MQSRDQIEFDEDGFKPVRCHYRPGHDATMSIFFTPVDLGSTKPLQTFNEKEQKLNDDD